MEYNKENNPDEVWKDVPGYEGLYLVSNQGRVKRLPIGKQWSYRKTHNNIRKPKLATNGYFQVNLSKNNKVKFYNIHRLVAMAFIPNPLNLPCVNHKNEIKTDNRVQNLEWCTILYNCNYGTGVERQKISRINNPNDKFARKLVGIKNSKPVRQLTPDGEFIALHRSLTDASLATGVHISQISRHCNGKVGNNINRPVRKYKFEYAEN